MFLAYPASHPFVHKDKAGFNSAHVSVLTSIVTTRSLTLPMQELGGVDNVITAE